MNFSPWYLLDKGNRRLTESLFLRFWTFQPTNHGHPWSKVAWKMSCCTPRLHHMVLLTFSENSHKQILLAHMESKQPGWMEEHCPDTPWVPGCPSCLHPPRQCLVGVTPLRGSLWNQKVTCATWELSIQEQGCIKSYCHSRKLSWSISHLLPVHTHHTER